ncbi:MAG: hypothetical protein M3041_06625 [Acidobacteriota bacterium]|nr:hypothetical protein [Acidobacteriota bacterium]
MCGSAHRDSGPDAEAVECADWSTDQKILATAAIRGDLVEIRNVRNFRYRSETDYTPAYETRTYDLRKLDSVWFVVERRFAERRPRCRFIRMVSPRRGA